MIVGVTCYCWFALLGLFDCVDFAVLFVLVLQVWLFAYVLVVCLLICLVMFVFFDLIGVLLCFVFAFCD